MTGANSVSIAAPSAAARSASISLPLVSVVITNYNYGRFLEEATRSALEQTYPRIEILIVDDASNDDSAEAMERIEAAHPGVEIVRNARNSGQTFSFVEGLRRSRGDYVIFLDADDILLPEAVATHIFVHLSSKLHAGFTSSDHVEMENSTLVAGPGMPRLPESEQARSFGSVDAMLRVIAATGAAGPGLAPTELEAIVAKAAFIHPGVSKRKYFAPTSGNCFRRAALELFLDAEAPMSLRLNADVYIREAVYALAGCILIDRALFAYRIHGRNGFTRSASLFGRASADGVKNIESRRIANRAIAGRLLDRREQFLAMFGPRNYLLAFASVLHDVRIHASSDLADFCDFLVGKIDEEGRPPLDGAIRADLLEMLRRRTKPSRLVKHLAEFVLTAARIVHSRRLARLGEDLWDAS
jgi:glycosyltransferase involved in cell wall biosynthesis